MNLPSSNKKGFTLIELVVVTLIIGILVSIALMQLLSYRERGYNVTLQADLRSAYTASKQFHLDVPGGEFTDAYLEEYGYVPSDEHVDLDIIDGSEAGLEITASHPTGTPNIYQVDHAVRVSKKE